MQRDYTIRTAKPDEYDAMRDLTLAAYQQYAAVMPHWQLYRDHLLSTLANDDRSERIVAARGDKLFGSVLLQPPVDRGSMKETDSPWPEVRLLAVAPWARGAGVGRALLEACIERVRRSGGTEIGLHTEDVMTVAQQMYTRRGFVRSPEQDFHPTEGVVVKAYRLQLVDD